MGGGSGGKGIGKGKIGQGEELLKGLSFYICWQKGKRSKAVGRNGEIRVLRVVTNWEIKLM
jgi:hypothetical protein